MPALALADALMDFGAFMVPVTPPPPVVALVEQDPEAERLEDLLQAAVRETEQTITQRLATEHEAQLAALKAAHQAEIAAIADDVANGMAQFINERTAEIETSLIEQTTAVVARILAATTSTVITTRAVSQLADAIKLTLRDRDAVRLRVSGPASLQVLLEDRLDTSRFALEFSEATGPDLSVTVDEHVFATRLGAWSSDLQDVLA